MSKPKSIDFGGDEFSAHRNSHWLDKAINPHHPLALRVYFAALGRRKVGGHAPLDPGELAELLVHPGAELPDRRRVSEAIRQCVHWNYLAEGSNALCLVVPMYDVQGGKEKSTCRRSHKPRTAQAHKPACTCARCSKVSVPQRTTDPKVSVSSQDTLTPGVRAQADNSGSDPLIYLPTGPQDRNTTEPRRAS
ncbi:hypothetical protein [Nocardioides sp.]|uniref:hypothetical protein n=1 Tax=Nocardioides sp. TaxID=35761 RepID=UPI002B278147|nr:hypothetical protein [Nocardioides sp.]